MFNKKLYSVVCLFSLFVCQMSFGIGVSEFNPTGLTVVGDGWIEDSSGTAGPLYINRWDPNNASIYSWDDFNLSTTYSTANGSASAHVNGFEHEPGMYMFNCLMYSSAYCYSNGDDNAHCGASTWSGTVTDGVTNGYYIQIIPTNPGELPGDKVTVELDMAFYITIFGNNATCEVNGSNGMDHIAVTLNQSSPTWPDDPDPANEVWTLPNAVFTEGAISDSYSSFEAHIGDIIGIFVQAKSNTSVNGSDSSQADCNASLYLTLMLDTNPMDFNEDGFVNLIDFSTFASEWLWVRDGR